MSDFATGRGHRRSGNWSQEDSCRGAIGTERDGRIPDLPSLPKVVPKKYLRVFSFEDVRQ